jgi:hypothetical protein
LENTKNLEILPMSPARSSTKNEFLRALSSGELSFKPLQLESSASGAVTALGFDGVLSARQEQPALGFEFGFRCTGGWTRLSLQQLLRDGKVLRESSGLLPLLVTPYLSDRHIDELAESGLSGLDLSGNGILQAAPALLVRRSGAKSKHKVRAAPTYVYRSWKITTLVPRVFASERWFPAVQAVQDACRARMMRIGSASPPLTLSTVSKALSQLAADLAIARKGRELRLLHLDRILDGLVRGYKPPVTSSGFLGRTAMARDQVWNILRGMSPEIRAISTGRASASRYTDLAGTERLQLYVSDASKVAAALQAKPTEAFPNLELIETDEEAVYFDARTDAEGTWSSPVQSYLELERGGAREVEMARQLRAGLLQRLQP